jgi:tripartite-type tricarboxylate transporter receptor subunit TctC
MQFMDGGVVMRQWAFCTLLFYLLVCFAAVSSAPARAQEYPSKAIRLIVPFSPSGPTDLYARLVGKGLAERWGKPVVVDNRAGAGGNIAMELAAKSPADGYTIILASGFMLTVNPHIYKLPYDIQKDFVPISMLISSAAILVVAPSLPVKSVRELVNLAKARPNELTFGSSGGGGFGHVSGALFQMLTKTKMVHVPYKGSAPALTDLAAGNIMFLFNNIFTTMPFVKAGRVRALAVTSTERSPIAPDVPTVAEAGVPGYESITWNGLLAPAGTPPDIIAALNTEVVRVLNSPAVRERVEAGGGAVTPSTPTEFASKIRAETERMGEVIRFSGLKVQ